MKRISSVIGIILLFSLLAACSTGSASNEEDEVYELLFNIQVPATHDFHAGVVEPWANYVEEATDGRLKIEIYNSGALGNLGTAYEDIEGGVYDIGYVNGAMSSDTNAFPLTIGDLPFAISEPFDSTKVLKPFMEEFMNDSFEKSVPIAVSSTDSYQLYSTNPVETVEDVKNKKIIVSGEEKVKLVELWGGVPVTLGLEENYQALDKGTVDQTSYTAIGANGFSLFEVAPYLGKVDMGAAPLVYLVNKRAFDSLPEDLQTILLEELGPKLEELTSEIYSSLAEDAIDTFASEVEKSGGRVIVPSEKAMEEFRRPTRSIWEDWIETANKRGYDGEAMMDFFIETLEKEGLPHPFE